MSYLAILAGHINALLDGLRMLSDSLGVTLGLCTCLIALIAMEEGDWIPLLALVAVMGLTLVGILLAPLLPYGNLIGAALLVLGVVIAYWILTSRCPPTPRGIAPQRLSCKGLYPLRFASYNFIFLELNKL